MYVYINKGIVSEIIPDIDPIFPSFSVEKRFPEDFLKKCVHVSDDTDVKVGMVYNADDGTFSVPEVVHVTVEVDLDGAKSEKVAESKVKLAEWLAANPMQYDGKYYSVTEEKQSLLNSNLASFERADGAGLVYPLKWNATGEECTEWEYDDLVLLSLTIAAYVAPKVSKQQAIEIEINACETAEQVNEVVIDYDG